MQEQIASRQESARQGSPLKLAYISDLAVSKGQRRQGVGLQLLHAAEQVWLCFGTAVSHWSRYEAAPIEGLP